MAVKPSKVNEPKKPANGRVVKTSPRYGKLSPAQVRRAVTRVSKAQASA